jgi:TDG/mug DNA glycosylase family protein
VIVGTAVATASAASGHYYSGRGNDFWSLLHESGLTPVRLEPHEDRRLLEYGVGLTDLNKTVAQDRGLVYDVNGFQGRVAAAGPAWVAFHGKETAKAYARSAGHRPPALGRASWRVGGSEVFVLPNASGAARRPSYDGRSTRLEWWSDLAGLVRG